eukprot:GCRY01007080.1.p1 GENE.GCRY01007080.1~~GCRY01007080.1.p1  ORF type:complete len:281 (-),score=48.63 GCRY01007080.1:53-799(-)
MSKILIFKKKPEAKARLFCLPFAGGNAAAFRPLTLEAPDWLEVAIYQPPGRASRMKEPCFTHIDNMVDEVVEAITPMLAEKPFFFLGYSMGGRVGMRVIHKLIAKSLPLPKAMCVAAVESPEALEAHKTHYHKLPQNELLEVLKKYGNVPEVLLKDPQMVQMMLVPFRADWQCLETLDKLTATKIPMPLMSIGGRDDDYREDELTSWETRAGNGFEFHWVDGTHFFISDKEGRTQFLEFLIEFYKRNL